MDKRTASTLMFTHLKYVISVHYRHVYGLSSAASVKILYHRTQQINATNDPLPVMVWIHGGAFYMGSGNGVTDMFGPRYILDREVVLITLNYRLGPLGE